VQQRGSEVFHQRQQTVMFFSPPPDPLHPITGHMVQTRLALESARKIKGRVRLCPGTPAPLLAARATLRVTERYDIVCAKPENGRGWLKRERRFLVMLILLFWWPLVFLWNFLYAGTNPF
jgi:hypothetical protein